MTGRNDPCWCGSGKKWKKCHYPEESAEEPAIDLSTLPNLPALFKSQYGITLKTKEQIDGIRRSGHLAAKILDAACAMAKEGVTTEEINKMVVEMHKEHGAIPAPLNYGDPPFPKAICTSLNEVICHGIPDDRPLQDGDIMNIDVTCILDGFYGDCSRMVMIGNVSDEKKLVVETAYESLMRSIAILKPGILVSRIGRTISDYAEGLGCSVVNQFVGHGVGINFHEPPQIPHHRNGLQIPLAPGMVFTIEPMINAGVRDAVIDPNDGWTARTADGKPSAQWEHTLVITEDGCEILTPWNR